MVQDRPDMYSMGRIDSEVSLTSRPPTALSGTTVMTTSPNGTETTSSATGATVDGTLTQKKLERVQSNSRRDHAHHHSHSSRHHKDELKTVGEYALHVLLSSVRTPLSLPPTALYITLLANEVLVHRPRGGEA